MRRPDSSSGTPVGTGSHKVRMPRVTAAAPREIITALMAACAARLRVRCCTPVNGIRCPAAIARTGAARPSTPLSRCEAAGPDTSRTPPVVVCVPPVEVRPSVWPFGRRSMGCPPVGRRCSDFTASPPAAMPRAGIRGSTTRQDCRQSLPENEPVGAVPSRETRALRQPRDGRGGFLFAATDGGFRRRFPPPRRLASGGEGKRTHWNST